MLDALPGRSAAQLLYIHPALKLVDLGSRGHGYVAAKTIRRGELLLEERPLVWDAGKNPQQPDLTAGVDWLLRTGLVHELSGWSGEGTLHERAEALAAVNSFRHQSPCGDGCYPAMLFQASSRFNHSCFPNAGAYMPAGDAPSVAAYSPVMATFCLEDINQGDEACICYLSDVDQLSPARSRQAGLQEGWGFECHCRRCRGGRPLDQRLEGVTESFTGNRASAVARASREYRALFDPTAEDYSPPTGDYQGTVERLTEFREQHNFLDKAHCIMQRVRRELIAALLLGGDEGDIGRRFACPAAALLVEEMQVMNELLPMLSPCKVPVYARFLRVLRNVPEDEAVWLRRDVKVDGCEL